MNELALFGHEVAETSIAKDMVRPPDPKRGQSWSTFLANHMDAAIACDVFQCRVNALGVANMARLGNPGRSRSAVVLTEIDERRLRLSFREEHAAQGTSMRTPLVDDQPATAPGS